MPTDILLQDDMDPIKSLFISSSSCTPWVNISLSEKALRFLSILPDFDWPGELLLTSHGLQSPVGDLSCPLSASWEADTSCLACWDNRLRRSTKVMGLRGARPRGLVQNTDMMATVSWSPSNWDKASSYPKTCKDAIKVCYDIESHVVYTKLTPLHVIYPQTQSRVFLDIFMRKFWKFSLYM